MKSKCGKNLRDLSRWVDGEIKGRESESLAAHIETCDFCRQETAVFRALRGTLRSVRENVQVSQGFEAIFWERVSDRQRGLWFVSFLDNLAALVPMPNLRQAVAFSILAFFIGNMGGVASARYFSGAQDVKGIAPYSLAGAYLSGIKNEVSR